MVAEASRAPEIRAALDRFAFAPEVLEPAAFAARIGREREAWGPVVAASGFTPDEG